MTKTQDQLLFAYYNKNDGLRITDLHQGIVWGTQTERDPARRAADQPLRLRRRLRHGAQPLPDAGGDRLSADRARHRRPDPRLHPHPGHGALHRARAREPAAARRAGQDLQPDDRDPPRPRPRRAGRRASPAPRSTMVANPRNEADENDLFVENRRLLDLGPRADHARRGPAARGRPRSPSATPTACDRSKIPCRSLWRSTPARR